MYCVVSSYLNFSDDKENIWTSIRWWYTISSWKWSRNHSKWGWLFIILLIINFFKIKVILTVSSNPLTSQSLLFGAEYKFIYMLDMENQNIFADSLLENALDIIEESLRNERTILVHWYVISEIQSFSISIKSVRVESVDHQRLWLHF